MHINRFLVTNAVLAFLIVILDQITKGYAITHCSAEQKISSFFSCHLTFNRGISWGMLHDANSLVFLLVTLLIGCITAFIAYLALARMREGLWAFGYICVVAGSVSNLIDRVQYGAVVDFISVSMFGWDFPIFNIADAFIVGGIMMILGESMFFSKNNR